MTSQPVMPGLLRRLSGPRAFASDLRALVRFRLTGSLPLEAGNLNGASREIACAAFSDPAIAKAWERDSATIGGIYLEGQRHGGVNPGDRRALHALISYLKPERVLETGTNVGASTLHIALALRSVSAGARLTTVDIRDVNGAGGGWLEGGLLMSPGDHAERLGCLDAIRFEVAPSVDFMRRLRGRALFDFVFLDGDHDAATVYREMSAALALLAPGGVIVLHDYYPQGRPLFPDHVRIKGPYRALRRIRSENPAIAVHPLGALPWPTKQGSNVTSLAMVTKRDCAPGSIKTERISEHRAKTGAES